MVINSPLGGDTDVNLLYKIVIKTVIVRHDIIATARVLPKATQRELFRLGAYSRYSQSHY